MNPLLNYCRQQQWEPRHLSSNGPHSAEINKEAKAALNAGRPELCLGLIRVAEALDLVNEEQLELKTIAVNKIKHQSKKNQEEVITAGNSSQDFVNDLLEICSAEHWKPQFIEQAIANKQMTELETNVIKEAEITRNNGAAKLSLMLLDRALQHGCASLWIHHSKAVALSQLQQFDLAHQLWDILVERDNLPEFVSVVENAYQASQKRQQAKQSTALLQALIGRIQQDHLHPQVLPSSGELSDDADLQTMILEEAETLRNQDQAQLSLDLINLALDYGCDSLWLFHNKALALQKLGDLETAIAIWNGLSHHQIEGFSNNVQTALGIAEQELILKGAENAEASGDLEIAIETLTNALLNDPNQYAIETSLKTTLRKRRHGGTVPTEISPIEDHLDELDLNHVFLMQAEERLAGANSIMSDQPH